jgi:MOSC domain-containing protein YiiM
MMIWTIDSVLTGQVTRFADSTSAIEKSAVEGPRRIGFLGIEGDTQADLTVHGGPDKAIHHYPRDHYGFWRATLGDLPVLGTAGAFGENISTTGLTETTACIGDRYRLGTALVEIAQGRQPCWKQGHRLGDARAVLTMVKTRYCGWYYRVLEEGAVAASDVLALIDRPHPDWTVARVIGLLIAGEAKQNPAAARDLAALAVLADGWRKRAAKVAG